MVFPNYQYLLFILFSSSFTVLNSSSNQERFYIYDWPSIVSKIGVAQDVNESVSVYLNGGAGRLLEEETGSYNTDQYQLFSLMYHRALKDPRRTLNPDEATTFFIPYDFAVDSAYYFRTLDGKRVLKSRVCEHNGKQVMKLLRESVYFQRNHGKDHLLIVGLNYAMDYFVARRTCKAVLRACSNCTKFAIDDYSFLYPNNSNIANKGDYWHAVPFPSNFHWNSKVVQPFPWENMNRSILVSYIGSVGSSWHLAKRLRMHLVNTCAEHPGECAVQNYANPLLIQRTPLLDDTQKDPHRKLSQNSVFCFVPIGDMPTRKGLFDSILQGCIPVTFDPYTATSMYTWHWSEELWRQVAVQIQIDGTVLPVTDRGKPILYGVDPVLYLKDLFLNHADVVREKQRLIQKNVFRLQYALEGYMEGSTWPLDAQGQPIQDAYEVSMNWVLGWSTGRLNRTRTFTVSECWANGVVVNNYCV